MSLLLRLLIGLLIGAFLAAALLNAFEHDWGAVVLELVAAVGLLVVFGVTVGVVRTQRGAVRRRAVREQELTAPAEIIGLRRTSSSAEDSPRFRYLLTLRVTPPDLPPYRSHIERDIDPLIEADDYKKGAVMQVALIDAETGEVEQLGRPCAGTPTAGGPAPEEWRTIRAEWLDTPRTAVDRRPGDWRGLRIPPVKRTPRWFGPFLPLAVVAGFAAALLLLFGDALSSTVERMRLGELDPSLLASSSRAEAAAEDAAERAGNDEFYSLHLRDDGYHAEIAAPDSLKIGSWSVTTADTFVPGAFREWTDPTFKARDSFFHTGTFVLEEVRWAAIPEVRAEGSRICESRYDAEVDRISGIRITSVEGEVRFAFQSALDTGESCSLEFDDEAREIER